MVKKKNSTKEAAKPAPAPSKQKLDDFLANWSDDDDEEQDKKVVNGGNKHVANGKKDAVNGHKKPASLAVEETDESDDDEEVSDEELDIEEEEELDGEGSDEDEFDEEVSGEEDELDGEEEFGEEEEASEGEEEEEGEEGSGDEGQSGATQQKKYLASLKDKDPEFYKFLKENDEELLKFDESSSEDEDAEDSVHKPPEALEVASDDSDYEEEDELDSGTSKKRQNQVTKLLLDKWTEDLASKPSQAVIAEVVQAFRSAVLTISPTETEPAAGKGKKKKDPAPAPKVVTGKYIVEGSTAFNGIVRLCLTGLLPAFNKVLGLGSETSRRASHPSKAKSWPKLNKHLKIYTQDLVTLMTSLTTGSVLAALLKHVQNMVPYFVAIPKSCKLLTKCLVNLWSGANEEAVRVLAFMCIIRMARISMERGGKMEDDGDDDDEGESSTLLETILKQMYMAYIRNVKFTSPSAWPMIHFMRRSLAEVFNLNHQVAYRYAFIYIRQLTIHLRNAMLQQKGMKDSPLDSVYNWQFVHCTDLWTQLLCESHPSEVLEPLVYPLVQVISGAIRLVYTPKYYPLRFHLCSQLIRISSATKKFIPLLAYYLDVINKYNFNKKTSKLSMKPLDFSCCLKVSKSQLVENGFKDAVMEQVYCGIFEYLNSIAHKISFPEVVIPLTFQIKSFLKQCKVANYCKKLKQVHDKVIENGKFVMERRRKVTFGVKDLAQIQAWEAALRSEGTPISKFYTSFRKVKEQERMKDVVQNDKMDDYDFVPALKKKAAKTKAKEEFKGLLGDDDESDDDEGDSERFKLKEERNKKSKRKRKESESDASDSEDEREVKQRKLAPKKSAEKAKPEPEDDDDDDDQDEVEDLDMDAFGSDDDAAAVEDEAGSDEDEEQTGSEEEESDDDDDEESDDE